MSTIPSDAPAPRRRRAPPDDYDGIVVLNDVDWWQYEAILAVRGDGTGARIAYLDGVIELMSPSARHEEVKKLLARLIEAYADARDINLYGRGSMTTKAPELKRGAEPDECYVLDRAHKQHDLVVEVVFTSGGIDKLEIYRGLGAKEVWFWIDDALEIYVLEPNGYRHVATSQIFPELDIPTFERFARSDDQALAVREFKRAVMKQ